MNREEISRLILDAGNGDEEWAIIAKQLHKHFPDELEAFAALVASAEREECKKLCTWKTGNQFVDEAVAVCYRAIDQRGQA